MVTVMVVCGWEGAVGCLDVWLVGLVGSGLVCLVCLVCPVSVSLSPMQARSCPAARRVAYHHTTAGNDLPLGNLCADARVAIRARTLDAA